MQTGSQSAGTLAMKCKINGGRKQIPKYCLEILIWGPEFRHIAGRMLTQDCRFNSVN